MDKLPGADEAGAYLAQAALREFGPVESEPDYSKLETYKRFIDWELAPLPRLLKLALELVGLRSRGPGEKTAWSTDFMFRGAHFRLAHQKFGLRLYVTTDKSEADAEKLLDDAFGKLLATKRTVERLLLDSAPDLLSHGRATVLNQHWGLEHAYRYFRERAEDPEYIPDVITHHPVSGSVVSSTSYSHGESEMKRHAFHDLVAAITAFLSKLEHELVLGLTFAGFDPAQDDLTAIIGARWGQKWDRVLGRDTQSREMKDELAGVVERWRNPYAHGGFEKGHAATIYVHAPGVGAVPVGLTNAADSPLFTLSPASEDDVTAVFALLDKVDAWVKARLPAAISWIQAGLDVRFDSEFRVRASKAIKEDRFEEFLDYEAEAADRVANMDF